MGNNPKIEKLEDLIVWQKARKLLVFIYNLTDNFPKSEEYNLKKHQRECARNIPGNIAEGYGRFHYQECMQFYRIARGSLQELKSDLYCSRDLTIISEDQFKLALEKINELNLILNGVINSSYTAKHNNS